MVKFILSAGLLLCWLQSVLAQEPIIGGPCQGCEFVFVGMPEQLPSDARIAPPTEKGEPLLLSGTVYSTTGIPASGIIVYAYQTDAQGKYPKGSTWHGSLRGWAKTDSQGRYQFSTIRPQAYPGRTTPQHIHMHVIEPGKATYYIDDVTFSDDPLLTPAERNKKNCRGGCGLATPVKNEQGVWLARRDLYLRVGIAGDS